jgi:hypothetical protein
VHIKRPTLFFTGGGIAQIGGEAGRGNALDQAAMIQMFAIDAWPESQLPLLH